MQNRLRKPPVRTNAPLRACLVLTFLLLFSATMLLILMLDSSAPHPLEPDPEAAQKRFPSMSFDRIPDMASGVIDRAREAIRELRELLD